MFFVKKVFFFYLKDIYNKSTETVLLPSTISRFNTKGIALFSTQFVKAHLTLSAEPLDLIQFKNGKSRVITGCRIFFFF